MSAKKSIIALISLMIVAILAGGIYYFSKNSPGLPSFGLTESNELEELRKILSIEGDDSLALINKALNEGEIDNETALIYKAYAIFSDERLPVEYQSKVAIFGSNASLHEMQVNFDTLTPATQEILKPFLTRPEDPQSYINQRYFDKKAEQTGLLIKSAHATRPDATLYTDFLVSSDNKVKIWYPNDTVAAFASVFEDGEGGVITSKETSKKMADMIKKHLDEDRIMQRYVELLNKQIKTDGTRGGDDKLDIYVAPAGTDLGLSWGESSTPCSSYIFINISIGAHRDTILKTVLAHEIFHSYQYAYKYNVVKDNWWGEATAVWAEDFIYPDANTEQPRLPGFLHHPTVELYKENPPPAHHYSAYIFPYFITKKYGNDFMRKSWEGCDGKDCLTSMDELIEGGFKKQWKEFTLWNYNREPAKFYTDTNEFPAVSSADSPTREDFFIAGESTEIINPEILPLSAKLADAVTALEDKEIKLLTFKELRNFTGLSDKAAIKAIIYYKNGKKEIEDWTEISDRSFCIENKDEDFEKISLIFSNADMKNKIAKSTIKIEGKDNCYRIDQQDKATATIHFPYADSGALLKVNIPTDVEIISKGATVAKKEDAQKYDYLTKWKMNYEFEQIRKAFDVSCGGSNVQFDAGWTSRSAGFLEFDLKLADPNATEGTFGIDMTYGLPHPHGNYEEIPAMTANCISTYLSATSLDLSGIQGTIKNVYQGKIFDMTEEGAKIEIPNSCLYSGCAMATGEPFQTMDKIILNIKK